MERYRILKFPLVADTLGYYIKQYYCNIADPLLWKVLNEKYPSFIKKIIGCEVEEIRFRIKTKGRQKVYELTANIANSSSHVDIEIYTDVNIIDTLLPFTQNMPICIQRIAVELKYGILAVVDIYKNNLEGLIMLEVE